MEQSIGAWRDFVSARTSYGRLQELLREMPEQPAAIELPQGMLDNREHAWREE